MTKYMKATLEQNVWMQNDLPCWRATACKSMMTPGGEILKSRGKRGKQTGYKGAQWTKIQTPRNNFSLSSIGEWASRAKGHCSLYAINVVPMTLFLELLRGLCLSLPFSFPLLTDTQYAGFDVLLQCFTEVNLHRSRCLLHTDGLEPKVVWEAASKAYILGQKELFVLSFITPSTIVDTNLNPTTGCFLSPLCPERTC